MHKVNNYIVFGNNSCFHVMNKHWKIILVLITFHISY